MSREAAIILFRSQFDRSGGPDACHPWTGSLRPDGYGQATYVELGGTRTVHTLLWEIEVGEIPIDPTTSRRMNLDHTCHNDDPNCPGRDNCAHRRCGNLKHIMPKTRQENLDAADKPRARGRFRTNFDCGCEITEGNTYLITRKGTRNGKPRTPERRCRKHERIKQAVR